MGITLTPDVEQRIAAKVESGEYQSPDEVLRAGLDLLEGSTPGIAKSGFAPYMGSDCGDCAGDS